MEPKARKVRPWLSTASYERWLHYCSAIVFWRLARKSCRYFALTGRTVWWKSVQLLFEISLLWALLKTVQFSYSVSTSSWDVSKAAVRLSQNAIRWTPLMPMNSGDLLTTCIVEFFSWRNMYHGRAPSKTENLFSNYYN